MILIKFMLVILIILTITAVIVNICKEKKQKKILLKIKNILLIISIGAFSIAIICASNFLALIAFFVLIFGIVKIVKNKKWEK